MTYDLILQVIAREAGASVANAIARLPRTDALKAAVEILGLSKGVVANTARVRRSRKPRLRQSPA